MFYPGVDQCLGVNQCLRVAPKSWQTPFYVCVFLFLALSLLFLFVTEKDGKTCLNGEKDDFDQQTACEAPIHWSKYTTRNDIENYKRETETTSILRNGNRKRPKSCPLSLPLQIYFMKWTPGLRFTKYQTPMTLVFYGLLKNLLEKKTGRIEFGELHPCFTKSKLQK